MQVYITTRFELLAAWISHGLGRPRAFLGACLIVLVWAAAGPIFGFSDTWQLVINTGTTISTFLMVFLLQNTGNRTINEMHDRLCELERLNRELLREIRAQRETAGVETLRRVA